MINAADLLAAHEALLGQRSAGVGPAGPADASDASTSPASISKPDLALQDGQYYVVARDK